MNTCGKWTLGCALAVALIAGPVVQAQAQPQATGPQIEPMVVVSVGSLDDLLADVGYLTRAAGAPEFGGLITLMAGQYMQMVDTKLPAGLYVTAEEMDIRAIGFAAVKDLQAMLKQLEEQVGPAEDVGEGVFRVGADQPMYVKQQGPWAFVSNASQNLAVLPEDPAELLGELPQQYTLAVRLTVQNIPAPMRELAIAQMEARMEQALEQAREDQLDPARRELAERLGQRQLKSWIALVEEMDQATIGWAIDSQAQATQLDVSLMALEGTTLAAQMALQQDLRSNFAGFRLPDAAVRLNLTSQLSPQDIEQLGLTLQAARRQASEAIEQDETLPDEQARAKAKQVIDTLFDVAQATVEAGKLDGGMAVMVEPELLQFASGGHVADGPALDRAFRELVELAEQQPDAPEVSFEVAQHAGVTFHSLQFPIPAEEADARQLLGDKLEVLFGTGEESFYLSFGKESLELVKQVIDKSQAEADQIVTPLELTIALAPILKSAAAIQEEPLLNMLASVAEKAEGKDRVSVTATPTEGGVTYRLEIQEGVLRVAGQAARLLGAGLGGPQGVPPQF